MSQVEVRLYAGLRAYVKGATSVSVDIEPGETIARVLEKLSVPLNQTRIIFVNHRAANLDQELVGGEELGVFPAIGGG
jgi:molybdopterin converting factor small subunit